MIDIFDELNKYRWLTEKRAAEKKSKRNKSLYKKNIRIMFHRTKTSQT